MLKTGESPPLAGETRQRRMSIAQGVLGARLVVPDPDPERLRGGRLLVVDDVLTEGNTIQEVARALRLAGAAEVAGIVLARQGWRAAGGRLP